MIVLLILTTVASITYLNLLDVYLGHTFKKIFTWSTSPLPSERKSSCAILCMYVRSHLRMKCLNTFCNSNAARWRCVHVNNATDLSYFCYSFLLINWPHWILGKKKYVKGRRRCFVKQTFYICRNEQLAFPQQRGAREPSVHMPHLCSSNKIKLLYFTYLPFMALTLLHLLSHHIRIIN